MTFPHCTNCETLREEIAHLEFRLARKDNSLTIATDALRHIATSFGDKCETLMPPEIPKTCAERYPDKPACWCGWCIAEYALSCLRRIPPQ